MATTISDVEFGFGTLKKPNLCYGGSGSCSLKWLDGLSGTYNCQTRKYEGLKMPQDFHSYPSPILCLASDNQLKNNYGEAPGLALALEQAGFFELGGWRSAHGTYNCHLYFYEPRAGKDDGYNKGDAYHFYPNPEVFKGAPGCGGKDNGKLQKELESVRAELEAANKKLAASTEKLAAAETKIQELKTAAAERRLLRKAQRNTSSANNKKEGSTLLRSEVRKPKGVRMGGRNAL